MVPGRLSVHFHIVEIRYFISSRAKSLAGGEEFIEWPWPWRKSSMSTTVTVLILYVVYSKNPRHLLLYLGNYHMVIRAYQGIPRYTKPFLRCPLLPIWYSRMNMYTYSCMKKQVCMKKGCSSDDNESRIGVNMLGTVEVKCITHNTHQSTTCYQYTT